MRIDRSVFTTIVPASHRTNITRDLALGKTLYRVHRYYCTPLTLRGKCPGQCNNCKPLPLVFRKLHKSPDVNSRHALLVWLLRNAVADAAELSEAPKVKTEKDWLGMDVQSSATSFRKTLLNIGEM